MIKTGLGKRIALYFVGRFGKKMMGVAYGMALADVVIGPGITSASARGGGIMYPIMQSIADAYESKPGPTLMHMSPNRVQLLVVQVLS